MLIRISLIIAIIAGLAAGALNFIKVKEKIDNVVAERESEKSQKQTAQSELATTKNTLSKTEKDLTKTKETLASTELERDKAVNEAQTQIKKAGELAEKLNKTSQERDDARSSLAAYVATGFEPPQILALGKQIKQAQEALEVAQTEKKIIQTALDKKTVELARFLEPDFRVKLPASLKGKVLVADPKWEFVVLNIGEDQGARKYAELLVSRDGKLVAKIVISDVQKGRCIANLMSGWKLSDVTEGDLVIPANPES